MKIYNSNRNYNCLSCVNRTLCEKNNAIKNECVASLCELLAIRKQEKKQLNKQYKEYIKNIKNEIRKKLK